MTKRLMSKIGVYGLTMAVLVLLVVGCSSQWPLAPNTPQNPPAQLWLPTASEEDTVFVTDILSPVEDDSLIVSREWHQHRFKVKSGALYNHTKITALSRTEYRITDGAKRLVFEFGPDGLVFRKTANLSVDITELDPNATSATLYYFDPKTWTWVYQATCPANDGRVEFQIYHFSNYAIENGK